jgi:hypothetical protein
MTFAWFRQSAYPFVAIGRSVRAWVTGKPVDYPAAYLALTGAAGTAMGDHDSPDAAAHV